MPVQFEPLDPSKIVAVDLQSDGTVPMAPWWMLALPPGSVGAGKRLVALERRIAEELGIRLDLLFLERWSGPFTSPAYDSEDDCRRVAIELMRLRPKLRVFVSPSDPAYGEAYSPALALIS